METFLENCDENVADKGRARLLLAECYQKYKMFDFRSNQHNHAVKFLESYIAPPENGIDEESASAYGKLGKLYSDEGKFDLAVDNYQKQYNALTDESSDKQALRSAMVNLGIATANSKMEAYFKTVADPNGVKSLIEWKATRSFQSLCL